MKKLGADLGFYQVKMATEEGHKKFTSIIGYPSAVELSNEEEPLDEHHLSLIYKDKTYYIGHKALRDTPNPQLTFTADKTDHITDRIKYLSLLGLALDGHTKGNFQVVTGLPVDEFAGYQGLRDKVKQNMEGQFDYTFGGQKIRIHVDRVTVIPQSAGAYYDYIMNDDGTIHIDHVLSKIIVIDVGFRTTDVVTMLSAKYSSNESFSLITGVSDIYKEIRKRLLKEYRLTKSLAEIDTIARQGFITLGSKPVMIRELIEEATRPVAEKILSELPIYIQNMQETDQILITGGGAAYLVPYIQEQFGESIPCTIMNDAEFSNAKGYYKYAHFIAAQGGE